MPTQLEEVVNSFVNIKDNWAITKNQLDNDFEVNINRQLSTGGYKQGNNIRIHDYKIFLNIDPATGQYNAGNLLDLSNIVHSDIPTLQTHVNNLNASYQERNEQTNYNNSNYETVKNTYDSNKEKYITSKEKIHGALMQAKTQNENYNYLVSSTINLLCGILILFYLIYKIYTPITVDEIKTAVKTTTDTASNVAKQAQSATNKIVSK